MKKKRLTPFSGSLLRLTLGIISGVAVLAVLFAVVEWTPVVLHKSTASFDNSSGGGLSAGDRRFLEHATALNQDQLALTELAARQAASERVRDFAQRLGAEHRRYRAELQRLAAERGAGPSAERGAAAALEREAPKHFDIAFLSRLIDAQAEAVELFERAATQCEDPELRAFAVKTLPAFQVQRAQATQLRKTVG